MYKYNTNEKVRDAIIFGEHDKKKYSGGIRRFSYLDATTLKQLIAFGFADPDDRQNFAPTLAEFLTFLENHPKFTAHGYVVTNERDDYRLSIEGVECETMGEVLDIYDASDFGEMFHDADEFEVTPTSAWCWYD